MWTSSIHISFSSEMFLGGMHQIELDPNAFSFVLNLCFSVKCKNDFLEIFEVTYVILPLKLII